MTSRIVPTVAGISFDVNSPGPDVAKAKRSHCGRHFSTSDY